MENKQVSTRVVSSVRAELIEINDGTELVELRGQPAPLAAANKEHLAGIYLDMDVEPAGAHKRDRSRQSSVSVDSLDFSNSQRSDDDAGSGLNVRDRPIVVGAHRVIAFGDDQMQAAFEAADAHLMPDLAAIVAHYVGTAPAPDAPAVVPANRDRRANDRRFKYLVDCMCTVCGSSCYVGSCISPAYAFAATMGLGAGATAGVTAAFTIMFACNGCALYVCCCKK